MKLLNVKKTVREEIEEVWQLPCPNVWFNKELFIRCNSKGIVDWENAPVYTKDELELRGDYQIIINLDINEFLEPEL